MTGRKGAGVIERVERRRVTTPDVERDRLRRAIARTAHPCGCRSGAAASILALVGWPPWVLATRPPGSALDAVLAVPLYLAVIVAAGAVGKVAGIGGAANDDAGWGGRCRFKSCRPDGSSGRHLITRCRPELRKRSNLRSFSQRLS